MRCWVTGISRTTIRSTGFQPVTEDVHLRLMFAHRIAHLVTGWKLLCSDLSAVRRVLASQCVGQGLEHGFGLERRLGAGREGPAAGAFQAADEALHAPPPAVQVRAVSATADATLAGLNRAVFGLGHRR